MPGPNTSYDKHTGDLLCNLSVFEFRLLQTLRSRSILLDEQVTVGRTCGPKGSALLHLTRRTNTVGRLCVSKSDRATDCAVRLFYSLFATNPRRRGLSPMLDQSSSERRIHPDDEGIVVPFAASDLSQLQQPDRAGPNFSLGH
jgi:hypothetical protein